MKNIYILIITTGVLILLFSSCKKDETNKKSNPIEGTWELTSALSNGQETLNEWQPDTAYFICNSKNVDCPGHIRTAYLTWEINGDHSLKETLGIEITQNLDANCNCKDSAHGYPSVSKYKWALTDDEKNLIFTYWSGNDTLPVLKLTSEEFEVDIYNGQIYKFKKK